MKSKEVKTTTLIEIIREQYKRLGRPLKVIVDIDECLQAVKPVVIYELLKEPKPSFKEF